MFITFLMQNTVNSCFSPCHLFLWLITVINSKRYIIYNKYVDYFLNLGLRSPLQEGNKKRLLA